MRRSDYKVSHFFQQCDEILPNVTETQQIDSGRIRPSP